MVVVWSANLVCDGGVELMDGVSYKCVGVLKQEKLKAIDSLQATKNRVEMGKSGAKMELVH